MDIPWHKPQSALAEHHIGEPIPQDEETMAPDPMEQTSQAKLFSLSMATMATAYRIFQENSEDFEEATQMSRGVAEQASVPFEGEEHERRLQEIKWLSSSRYSQSQFEENILSFIDYQIDCMNWTKKDSTAKGTSATALNRTSPTRNSRKLKSCLYCHSPNCTKQDETNKPSPDAKATGLSQDIQRGR